jgi:hypothetical protein
LGSRGPWRSHESTPGLSTFGANLTKTTHFTSLRDKTYVAGKDSSPMCFDCYVLHYYLSWYCHLAMERDVYMNELQPLQGFAVFRQALCLLMQYSHEDFELYNMTIHINDQKSFQRSTCFFV